MIQTSRCLIFSIFFSFLLHCLNLFYFILLFYSVSPRLQKEHWEHEPNIIPCPKCVPSNRDRDSFPWSPLAKGNLKYSLLIQYSSSKEIILSGASVLGQEGKATCTILLGFELLPQVNAAVKDSI